MTNPQGGAPEGGAPPPAGDSAPPSSPSASPPASTPPPTGGESNLDEHDDGLFEEKPGDPAWIRALRRKGAGYRVERNQVRAERDDYKGKYEALLAQNEQREQQALQTRRAEVARRHGLWDEAANDGKGGLLPGIDLGNGTPEQMEQVAQTIVSRLRGERSGGGGRRPVTVTGTASGTPDSPQPGAGRAATAIRDLMRQRGARSTE